MKKTFYVVSCHCGRLYHNLSTELGGIGEVRCACGTIVFIQGGTVGSYIEAENIEAVRKVKELVDSGTSQLAIVALQTGVPFLQWNQSTSVI